MNIYTGLLFQHGYIHDAKLAMSLAGVERDDPTGSPGNSQFAAPTPGRRPERRIPYRRNGLYSECSNTLSPCR